MSNISFKQRLAEILQGSGGGFVFSAAGRTSQTEATIAGEDVDVTTSPSRITLSLSEYPRSEEVLASELVNGVFALVNMAPCDFCILDSEQSLIKAPVVYRDRISYIDLSDFSEDETFTILERSYTPRGYERRVYRKLDELPLTDGRRILTIQGASPADFVALGSRYLGMNFQMLPMRYVGGNTLIDLTDTEISVLWLFFLPSYTENKTLTAATGMKNLSDAERGVGECCLIDSQGALIVPYQFASDQSMRFLFNYYERLWEDGHWLEVYDAFDDTEQGTLVTAKSFSPIEREVRVFGGGTAIWGTLNRETTIADYFNGYAAARIGTNDISIWYYRPRRSFRATFEMPDTPVAQGKAEIAIISAGYSSSYVRWSTSKETGAPEYRFGEYVELPAGQLTTVFFKSTGGFTYPFEGQIRVNLTLHDGQRVALLVPFCYIFPIYLETYDHPDYSGAYYLSQYSALRYESVNAETIIDGWSWLFGHTYSYAPKYIDRLLNNGIYSFNSHYRKKEDGWHHSHTTSYCSIPTGYSNMRELVAAGSITITHTTAETVFWVRERWNTAEDDQKWLVDYPAAHPGVTVTKVNSHYRAVATFSHKMTLTGSKPGCTWSSTRSEKWRFFAKVEGETYLREYSAEWYENFYTDYRHDFHEKYGDYYMCPVTIYNLMSEPFSAWAIATQPVTTVDYDAMDPSLIAVSSEENKNPLEDGIQFYYVNTQEYHEGSTTPAYYFVDVDDEVTPKNCLDF